MEILEQISEDLQEGDQEAVKEGIKEALKAGVEPGKILEEGLLAAMNIIGKKFKNNEIFVPEVLISARAMNSGMELLKPELIKSGIEAEGKIVLGTVKDDLHDIGKNLVRMMLEGTGFEVFDLGTDVEPEEFVAKVKEEEADIVGISALLTTTMGNMKEVIEKLAEEGLREGVFIMVGGAPITEDFAKKIGADSYASNASDAADIAQEHLA